MKYFFLFLALILMSYKISGFESNDFCKRISINYKCKHFECSKYFCSLDKKSCDNLISWKLNSKNNYFKYSRIYKEQTNMFKRFIENIKYCEK